MTTTIIPVSASSRPEADRRTPFAGALAEECLVLLDRLDLGRTEPARSACAVGMTSCLPAEGVTTLAAETAAAAATHLRLRTVLVDCHFARPAVHRVFGVGLCPGLRDALEDDAPLTELVRPSGIESLFLVTAGNVQKDERGTWLSPSMARFIDELRAEFDLLLFDLPPLTQGRPIRMGTLLDGVVLVVEAERVHWQVAQRATTSLKSAGVTLLGAVMNKRRRHLPGWLGRKIES